MKSNKKRKFNLYKWLIKNKKLIVSTVSILIVVTLLFGVFSQLFYVFNMSNY